MPVQVTKARSLKKSGKFYYYTTWRIIVIRDFLILPKCEQFSEWRSGWFVLIITIGAYGMITFKVTQCMYTTELDPLKVKTWHYQHNTDI